MKNLLITGGAGFIGSNFVRYMFENSAYNIIILDDLTYAGNLETIEDALQDTRCHFIQGNICDEKKVQTVMQKYEIDAIINFAAESHVDRSIKNPFIFLKTNVLGTQVLLDAAYQAWAIEKGKCRSDVCFLQVSTDEVYGSLNETGLFSESTPLSPNSPYSASKASADMMVNAYSQTYKLPVNITRCSNNYGPYQYPEKLIPLMIQHCKKNLPLPVYGDGLQIRDWLHVSDHCSAIHCVLEKGTRAQVYNIGGNNELTNLEIVRIILKSFDMNESLISFVADRLGHDRRYAIDNTKITTTLGWKPLYSLEQGLDETITWYKKNNVWLEMIEEKINTSLC